MPLNSATSVATAAPWKIAQNSVEHRGQRREIKVARSVPVAIVSSETANCRTIAIALATEPKLLCLDEPTAGMSVTETHATIDLIRRIAANLTILIVEHDMEVVMGLARTITVLHYGEVLAEGSPAAIQGNPRVQEVYLKT